MGERSAVTMSLPAPDNRNVKDADITNAPRRFGTHDLIIRAVADSKRLTPRGCRDRQLSNSTFILVVNEHPGKRLNAASKRERVCMIRVFFKLIYFSGTPVSPPIIHFVKVEKEFLFRHYPWCSCSCRSSLLVDRLLF